MSKLFSEILAEDRRLGILRTLQACADYESNESILAAALDQIGHRVSRDSIRVELAWLKEQGLLTLEVIADIHIAKLTQRGLETACGIITTPGVKRPGPQ
ncbi:MAG TPA: hypothetical protein VFB15_11700 [Candidatus Binataceae bacterium]|nr:hypothetical protein [Candidatus Binataceae bacterium]